MTTFVIAVLVIIALFQAAVVAWFVIKSNETDQDYDKEIDKIYQSKRKQRS
jgi:hypothetical protein